MKTIVVTGATKGIGKAICQKFAQNGFAIGACARNKQQLDDLALELKKMGAPKVFVQVCDVSQKTEIIEFAQNLIAEFKNIDILVNNAGVFVPGKISEEEDGMLEMMIDTNLYSAYHLTRQLLPKIKQSEKGHIFNLCSTASIQAYENGGSYCISKFAMLGMTKVLRAELKETKVKVTAIMPGATYTASWAGSDLQEDRFMKASEIADLVFAAYSLSGNAVLEELVVRPQLGDI